ncbi:PREDICTED: uncharacterized protein LOC109127565 [Camelina sativa]|uniref:Uncharacterized protein LOC109127565 n=1 Tax=Camelina sativa TaxID=90675 RepID=A0ABM1QMS3_CAMSA|nr:PREDICTED: uncharacterized protein LOC109127565 [Camelina sativa]
MAAKDQVCVVLGEWVKVDSFVWNFEPETPPGNNFVRLRDGMSYKQLVAKVKEKLVLRAHEVVIKMAYHYPAWFELDERNGSSPQYITDDEEVGVFVRMRRYIEEVDLCVTVVNKTPPQQPSPQKEERHWLRHA